MNVLMVRVGEAMGGAEIYNLNLIRGFRRFFPDSKLFFIVTWPEFSRRINNLGSRAFLLPVFKKEIGTKKDLVEFLFHLPKYLTTIFKTINAISEKESLDAICLQGTTEKIALTALLKLKGYQIFWLEHGPFFQFPKTWLINFSYRFQSRWVTKIITVSQDSRQDLLAHGLAKNKVVAIPTGIDLHRFQPLTKFQRRQLRQKWGLRRGDRVIGFIGAICQAKGIEKFFKISQRLLKQEKKIKFALVGHGPKLTWLKQKIHQKKLDDYFLLPGFRRDIRPYAKIFDLVVFPTQHHEGLSLALLEAAALGKPILTTDIGGNREIIIDQQTGFLFKNESLKKWVTKIRWLLAHGQARRAMGKRARQWASQRFNQGRWIKKLHEEFNIDYHSHL